MKIVLLYLKLTLTSGINIMPFNLTTILCACASAHPLKRLCVQLCLAILKRFWIWFGNHLNRGSGGLQGKGTDAEETAEPRDSDASKATRNYLAGYVQ